MESEVLDWFQNFAIQVVGQFYDPKSPTGLADGFIVEALFVSIAYLLGRAAQVGTDKDRSRSAVASDLLRDFRELHSFRDYGTEERPGVRARALNRLTETLSNINNRIDAKGGIAKALEEYSAAVQKYCESNSEKKAIWGPEAGQWETMATSLDALLKKLLSRKAYKARLKELEPLRRLKEYAVPPEAPKANKGPFKGFSGKDAPSQKTQPTPAPAVPNAPVLEDHPIGQ
ncbi:MAG: hypothetical protein GC184_06220 [Rhizobiales bacterium]|nr:hypothetical protein [Hyphomicrobiales bacterium]